MNDFMKFTLGQLAEFITNNVSSRSLDLLCSGAWLLVGALTVWMVLSPKVPDTLLERVALCAVSFSAFSRAFYAFNGGPEAMDSVSVSLSMAFYFLVMFTKLRRPRGKFSRCLHDAD